MRKRVNCVVYVELYQKLFLVSYQTLIKLNSYMSFKGDGGEDVSCILEDWHLELSDDREGVFQSNYTDSFLDDLKCFFIEALVFPSTHAKRRYCHPILVPVNHKIMYSKLSKAIFLPSNNIVEYYIIGIFLVYMLLGSPPPLPPSKSCNRISPIQ